MKYIPNGDKKARKYSDSLYYTDKSSFARILLLKSPISAAKSSLDNANKYASNFVEMWSAGAIQSHFFFWHAIIRKSYKKFKLACQLNWWDLKAFNYILRQSDCTFFMNVWIYVSGHFLCKKYWRIASGPHAPGFTADECKNGEIKFEHHRWFYGAKFDWFRRKVPHLTLFLISNIF